MHCFSPTTLPYLPYPNANPKTATRQNHPAKSNCVWGAAAKQSEETVATAAATASAPLDDVSHWRRQYAQSTRNYKLGHAAADPQAKPRLPTRAQRPHVLPGNFCIPRGGVALAFLTPTQY